MADPVDNPEAKKPADAPARKSGKKVRRKKAAKAAPAKAAAKKSAAPVAEAAPAKKGRKVKRRKKAAKPAAAAKPARRKGGRPPAGTPSRAQFLRDLFKSAPDTEFAAANAAWKSAGNKGEIVGSQFYALRSKILGPRRAGRKPAKRGRPAAAPAEPRAPRAALGGYAEIEHQLDGMIGRAGDEQLAELLRGARRRASIAILKRG